MSTYEPGTVATITDSEGNQWRAVKDVKGWSSLDPSIGWEPDYAVVDVRPLVTLDLDGRFSFFAEFLRFVAANADEFHGGLAAEIADQIEAQTKPPKPAEPQGLGAVVEDDNGDAWVHDRDPRKAGYLGVEWLNVRTQAHRHYETINAVRVLSKGVTP